jgi:hypothetical protein
LGSSPRFRQEIRIRAESAGHSREAHPVILLE